MLQVIHSSLSRKYVLELKRDGHKGEVKLMKIALGMIVKRLSSEVEIISFIENAEKYGHKLDSVILAHALKNDPAVEKSIREKVTLYTVDINNPDYSSKQMTRLGIPESTKNTLLNCPAVSKCGLVPYGFNRTAVVIEAILREIDILFFTDSDIIPSILRRTPCGSSLEEVDFYGSHLKHLNSGSDATTGEYSGYNILPPAIFDHMEDLLIGVQKESMLGYWQASLEHRCLVYQPDEIIVKPSNKVLGGNMAIRLPSYAKLPPFFSSSYVHNDEMFLCRGEDTVLGIELEKSSLNCTDVGIYPLHDTYKNYPEEPNLQSDPDAQERFYYAMTGWVGRNPFFNHILGNDLSQTRERQREHLAKGLEGLAKYTSNPKFETVLGNFDESWNNVSRYVDEFQRTEEAWQIFTSKALA